MTLLLSMKKLQSALAVIQHHQVKYASISASANRNVNSMPVICNSSSRSMSNSTTTTTATRRVSCGSGVSSANSSISLNSNGSDDQDMRLLVRGFSSSSGGGNNNKNNNPVSNFSLRRPGVLGSGEGGGGNDDGLSSLEGRLRNNLSVQNNQDTTTTKKTALRPHAIELFPGNYEDDTSLDDLDDDYYDSEDEDFEDEKELIAEHVQKLEYEKLKQSQKWLLNSKPPVRLPKIDPITGRSYGRGGRKTASARVWIQPGFGNVVVNKQDFVEYFDRETLREHILEPFTATKTCGYFDVMCLVQGGGLSGKAGAIRHGIARALSNYNPQLYRSPLKQLGYLTRDPRKVERKKVGHVKARKKKQWVKR